MSSDSLGDPNGFLESLIHVEDVGLEVEVVGSVPGVDQEEESTEERKSSPSTTRAHQWRAMLCSKAKVGGSAEQS